LPWRIAIVLVAAAVLTAATPAKKPAKSKVKHPGGHVAAHKSTAKKPARSAPAHASTPKKTTSRRTGRRTLTAHAARPRTRSAWHPAQTAPTPERYKEIQQALVQKGYLHGEPSGRWDQDSIDALRRFQHDQNLDASGKLDSLSLIALGLGPKH